MQTRRDLGAVLPAAPSAGSAKLAGQELRLAVAELRMQVGMCHKIWPSTAN